MKEHKARKRFGQNFLHDGAVIERIVQAISPKADDALIEIGPGLGALTAPVLKLAKKLTCIELDRDVIPILKNKCEGIGELNVVSADVLNIDFTPFYTDKKLRVYGNLPYNISTPLLFHLFKHNDVISDMTFMLQKEVVERMVAVANDDAFGRLSITVQYYCQPDLLFIVPPEAFDPAPKVHSAIVRLVPHEKRALNAAQEVVFANLVSLAFNARRKTLRNVWKGVVDPSVLEALQIDNNLRPENIRLDQYLSISKAICP